LLRGSLHLRTRENLFFFFQAFCGCTKVAISKPLFERQFVYFLYVKNGP
jgi:hypothetical protein